MFSRLILPLTRYCNLNCEYCYVDKRGNKSLPFLVGAKAVNFLMQNNKNKEVDLIFTGGEPLLEWEKMKKLIFYAEYAAKRVGALIRTLGFPTNGLLLNEDILSFCQKKNVKIAVSIDGVRNKRKTTEGFNSYFIIEKKFPLLLKYKDMVRIRLTIWPAYANKLVWNFKKFLKLGFVKFDIQPVFGVRWSKRNRLAYLNNLIKSFKVIRDENKKNNKKLDLKHLHDFLACQNQKKCCPKAGEELLVDIDGNIYPCEFFLSMPLSNRKKYVIGHVDKGIDLKLAKDYKKQRICQNSQILPALKNKCRTCLVSTACFKICSGFNLEEKKFDYQITQENWQLFRAIEKIFLKYSSLF